VVIGRRAAQYGRVSDEPRTTSELTPGVPIRTLNKDAADRTSGKLTARSGLEAIVDRVLLAGPVSFELFYRRG
jgi:hypothetical protein